MPGLLSSGANLPFSIALVLMLALAALEGISLILGLAASQILDEWLDPLVAEAGTEIDANGAELSEPGIFSQFLGWLHIGQLPLLILLIIFLSAFAVSGLFLQGLLHQFSGFYLPASVASLLVMPATLFSVRWGGGLIARYLPKDESEVVTRASFIGRVATITLGRAGYDSPAQAKLSDQFGQTHYLLVAPDQTDDSFSSGSKVLLVKQEGSIFRAIHNPHDSLIESPNN